MKPRGSDIGMAGMAPPAGGHGPVQPHETLWSIARQYKYAGVDMNQMVIGILRANPGAFTHGNVNNMSRGAMLNIPVQSEIAAIDAMQARNEYLAQISTWSPVEAQTGDMAPAPAKKPRKKPASGSMAKVDKSAKGISAEAAETIKRLEADLRSADEAAANANAETEKLRKQLLEMEQQVAELKQQVSEKDSRIASLEKQQKPAGGISAAGAPPTAKPEAKPAPAPAEKVAAAAPEAKPSPKPVAPAPAPAPKPAKPAEPKTAATKPAAKEPKPAPTPTPPKTETKPVASTPTPAKPADPKPVAKPPKPAPPPKPPKQPPPPEDDWMAMLMDNLPLIGGGIGGLAAIGGGLWFLRRRKKDSDGSSEPESILMSDATHGESEMATEDNPLSGLTTEETSFLDSLSSTGNFSDDGDLDDGDETSFLSDFVPSDIEALQEETGEVDPLAEADVYIAYGRFKQAEELVQQAMDKDPSRSDYRFKLFEVLHAAKDGNGFSKLMAESANMGLEDSNPDEWNRVLEMDKELSASGGAAGATADDDMDLDLGGLDDVGSSDDESDDMDLDFSDLDLGDSSTETETEPVEDSSDLEDLDGLDLTGLVGEDAEAATSDVSGSSDTEDDDLDFDLNFSEDTELAGSNEPESGDAGEFALDLGAEESDDLGGLGDLGDLAADLGDDGDLEITGLNKEDSSADEDSGSDDLLDFNLDGGLDDEPEPAPAAAPAGDVDPEEVETKLDLARAYVDMGDEEGARDILNEVVTEGTPEQQASAKELLGQIG
jgi:pilus assembly protein FimV